MGFIDSYKHLEKLCGEVLDDDRRVSAYIDEMISIPQGSRFVENWDEDLKALKHYRWVRNQIAHEPGCTEKNMCNKEDEIWIEDFYSRIINRTDPIAMYHRATSKKSPAKHAKKASTSLTTRSKPQTFDDNYDNTKQFNSDEKSPEYNDTNIIFTVWMILLLLVVMSVIIITKLID